MNELKRKIEALERRRSELMTDLESVRQQIEKAQSDLSRAKASDARASRNERKRSVLVMRSRGMTFREIGESLSVSTGRARELFLQASRLWENGKL